MSYTITFLGTSSMVPTKERNHTSIYVHQNGEGVLFDCGEGTQRQIKQAGIRPSKIRKIFISHWHGDHVLGIPGLIQTMGHNDYEGTLEIFGPKGTKLYMSRIFQAFASESKIPFKVTELYDEYVVEEKTFTVTAYELEHGTPCLGYRFEEKEKRRIDTAKVQKLKIPDGPLLGKLQQGKSIEWKGKKYKAKDLTTAVKGKILGLIFDTRLTNSCYTIARDVDLLVSEATFSNELKDHAQKFFHMTAGQSAEIAKKAGAKKLVLTHFSQRYKDPNVLKKEAKDVFKNVELAKDFMKVSF
jgi:ribonuclease Z